MEILLPLVAIIIIGYVLIRLFTRLLTKTTIYEYQTGLKYVNGQYQGLLNAGSYWQNELTTKIETVDTRPLHQTIPSQEVLSQDGIAVKISLVATIKVVDPEVAVQQTQDYLSAVYRELQQALRAAIGEQSIDQVLQARQTIGETITALVADKVRALGVEVSAVGIKDLTFPGSLKQTFAQVVTARQEGLAALERARGETAALRNLANGAKILENNPNLLHLRTLQALNESSGNTVVLKIATDESPS